MKSSAQQPMQTELTKKIDLSTGGPAKKEEGVRYAGVYVCMVIPSLMVATVGGGTQLATQKECLKMMGCYGQVCWHYLHVLCI